MYREPYVVNPPPTMKLPTYQYFQTAVQFGSLPVNTNYIPPQKNATVTLNCDCNTVLYSLVAACSLCQINAPSSPNRYALSKPPKSLPTNHE